MTIKTYGLVNEENVVVNVVLIDDESDPALFEEITKANNAIKCYDTDTYGLAVIGGIFHNGKLLQPKPFESWVLGEKSWEAPTPAPNHKHGYYCEWNESTLSWEEFEIPIM